MNEDKIHARNKYVGIRHFISAMKNMFNFFTIIKPYTEDRIRQLKEIQTRELNFTPLLKPFNVHVCAVHGCMVS